MQQTIYFAADHSGFELKRELMAFVSHELGLTVFDCGAQKLDETDDYPDYVHEAAKAVAEKPTYRKAVVLGASGQGEAMVANRYQGVRAAVYYGEPAHKQTDASGLELDMIHSTRVHNDANVLSLAARFIDPEEAKRAVKAWLTTEFTGEERHQRRITKIDK